VRVPIREALAGVGAQPQDVDIVINCHLHADHAGGNVEFPDARILVRPAELAAARDRAVWAADA
jgi:N-acyl homoserine lactone hydrolase